MNIIHDSQFFCRLREYEADKSELSKRGPEVERIHFVIMEMARKFDL